MKKYIIVENNSFKVIESENQPLSFALVEPNKTYNHNTYFLINTGMHISWLDEYKWNGKHKCLTVEYKKTKLFELNAVNNIQIVVDALNKYNNLTEDELKRIHKKALIEEKSELEVEVENLRIEKAKARKETKKYNHLIEQMKRIVQNIIELEEEEEEN
jgi:hypothetical protein